MRLIEVILPIAFACSCDIGTSNTVQFLGCNIEIPNYMERVSEAPLTYRSVFNGQEPLSNSSIGFLSSQENSQSREPPNLNVGYITLISSEEYDGLFVQKYIQNNADPESNTEIIILSSANDVIIFRNLKETYLIDSCIDTWKNK